MLQVENLPFYQWIRPYLENGQIRIITAKKKEYFNGLSEDSYAMHYLLSGSVKVYYIAASGRKFLLDEISEGQFAGHLTKVLGHKFEPSLKAMTECELLFFPRNIFDELLKIPEFAAFFYRKAADRVYYTYQKLLLNNLFSQKEMIAFYIYTHAKDRYFDNPLTDLEEELVISRRSVFYLLKQLRDDGILSQENKKYYIADLEKMEKFIEEIQLFKESMQ